MKPTKIEFLLQANATRRKLRARARHLPLEVEGDSLTALREAATRAVEEHLREPHEVAILVGGPPS